MFTISKVFHFLLPTYPRYMDIGVTWLLLYGMAAVCIKIYGMAVGIISNPVTRTVKIV